MILYGIFEPMDLLNHFSGIKFEAGAFKAQRLQEQIPRSDRDVGILVALDNRHMCLKCYFATVKAI